MGGRRLLARLTDAPPRLLLMGPFKFLMNYGGDVALQTASPGGLRGRITAVFGPVMNG